eukprot:c9864_g1_i2.p1 GENE.c9864_g1_i2~~c9864_g1_i2.p1  ORF type:complete len:160 (-),score=11.53 c9864_g1_i2:18-497(-)
MSADHVAIEIGAKCQQNIQNCQITQNAGCGIKLLCSAQDLGQSTEAKQSFLLANNTFFENNGLDVVVVETQTSDCETIDFESESGKALWQFDADQKGWLPYEPWLCEIIEHAYKNDRQTKLVLPKPFDHYIVDFMRREQTNKYSQVPRMIRRLVISDSK